MNKIMVRIDTFPYLVDKDSTADKEFFLKHKEKLNNIVIVADVETAIQLEKKKLGEILLFTYDSDEPEFRPKRMPPAVKKLLQNKIKETTEGVVDATDVFQVWLVADELIAASSSESKKAS